MGSPIRSEYLDLVGSRAADQQAGRHGEWPIWRIAAALTFGAVLGIASTMVLAPSSVMAGDESMQSFFRGDRTRAAPVGPAAAAPSSGFLAPLVRQFAPLPNQANLPQAIRFGTFGKDDVNLRKARKDDGKKLGRKGDDEGSQIGGGSIGGNGRRSVCVRMCDGYYFPLGKTDGDTSGHEALCQASCPSAPVRVYTVPDGADSIEQAVATDGKPYSSLPMAFAYQRDRDLTCTCKREIGKRTVSLLKDFTLRKGDAVVVEGKALVFRGSERWPYRQSDFSEFRSNGAGLGQAEQKDIDKVVGISKTEEAMRPFRRRAVAGATPADTPQARTLVRRVDDEAPVAGRRTNALVTLVGRAPNLTR